MKIIFTLSIYILILTGCATTGSSSSSYTAPVIKEIENERLVYESFDVIWDRIVAKLSSSYFVINNIDKESRLINLSFSSDSPENYINCGKNFRTFSFRDNKETYKYQVAGNSFYKIAGKWGPYKNLPFVWEVTRETSLEGRINVYLAPLEKNTTRFVTNVRYIISSNVNGIAYDYNGFGVLQNKQKIPELNKSISFNTGSVGSKNFGNATNPLIVKCQSTGVLENELLTLADN